MLGNFKGKEEGLLDWEGGIDWVPPRECIATFMNF